MKRKILVVDDSSNWVKYHCNYIKMLYPTINIDTANSAQRALARIEASIDSPYTTIFTDLQMESRYLPKLAGEWLIERIKFFREFDNTNIVIVSAYSRIDRIATKLNVDFIPKQEISSVGCDIYKRFIK